MFGDYEYYSAHMINGYKMYFYGVEGDVLTYCYYYDPAQKCEKRNYSFASGQSIYMEMRRPGQNTDIIKSHYQTESE